MKINKNLKLAMFFLIGVILFSSFVMAYYSTNYVQYGPYDRVDSFDLNAMFNDKMCEAGQDFILQINPWGCEPAVVRSDLLEEQNVLVWCPISATQINPLIDVEAINAITITGKYPKEVATVGFHPSQAALNPYQNKLNQPIFLENIGYAVIVLRKQSNESAMPEYVEGNLTARIRYDIRNAFGVGQSQFYLPVLNENDWKEKYKQYSFWDGRGYLRAEGVYNDEAKISIYSDRYRSGILGQGDDKLLYSSVNLKQGETSRKLYIPGFDFCLGTMQIRLEGLENPDTRARLRINGNPIEVAQGEKFLDNKCRIRKLDEQGINSEVIFICKESRDGFHTGDINLRITPNISLKIDGEEKNVEIGEYLGIKNKKGTKKIFLAYANTIGETNDKEDLYVYLMAIPEGEHPSNKLTLQEMENAKNLAQGVYSQTDFERDGNLWSFAKEIAESSIGPFAKFFEWLKDGESFRGIRYGYSKEVFGGLNIEVIGFAESGNLVLSEEIEEKFDLAVKDYEELINVYPDEENRYADNFLGEQALYDLIELANELNQKRTLRELCEEFEDRYPDSKQSLEICKNKLKASSSSSSITEVLIDNYVYQISFEDITTPSEYEYSAKIRVNYPSEVGGEAKIYTLTRDNVIYVNASENEYFMLEDLGEDFARLKLNIKSKTELGDIIKGRSEKISLNSPESFNSGYTLTLLEVNLKKVAKVSLIPNIDYTGTEASFNFRVNIDKRDIKLSPEKTQEKIGELDKKIEQWAKISDALGKIVKTLNNACLATSAYLNVKNYLENVGGKGIARDFVMNGDEGWYDKCAELVSQGGFGGSEEQCLIQNSENIDKDVNDLYGFMEEQQNQIKNIQKSHTEEGTFLSSNYVDSDGFIKDYSPIVKSNIVNLENTFNLQGTLQDPKLKGEDINLEEIKTIISSSSAFEDGKYTVEQLREIDLYSRILSGDASTEIKQMAEENLYSTLLNVQVNSRNQATKFSLSDSLNQYKQLDNVAVNVVMEENSKIEIYGGGETNSVFGNIKENTPIQGIVYNQEEYILELKNVDGENYVVENIYSSDGILINNPELLTNITNRIGSFAKYDEHSYENQYKNPEVRYYETAPYKGYPAVVPFDLRNGWYVAVQQIGGIAAYSESGRVENFYLCNVGRNGKEENLRGDDICRSVTAIQGDSSNQFPGISDPAKVNSLLRAASNAVEQAQRAYRQGIRDVTINAQNIKVGNPAVDVPGMRCQDFMSPKDCNILFNVCDPVTCPSSRCNFGGNYYVQNVAQSGIIGSIALCLPNAREGIVIPVCLSGVSAGVDGLLSIFSSYRDCLQESLDTGQTVGICDEIQSIYFCEFFYNQAIPLAKITIPKLTELIVGKGSRGGGEYLGVADAWQRAQSSVEYFSQYYAKNSYEAFKKRSIEEAGQEIICNKFLSLSYPNGGNLLDKLTTPVSPTQFYAKFDEIPYTTTTNPPQSQYKVYYHIYAGKDTGAYYRIYFRGDASSSFYQDTGYRIDVATGYAPRGEYVSDTKDFVAPSGYKELCVMVNNQEECGFSQVTTNFAVNYVRDSYVASQTEQMDITTEKECISGTSSLSSLVNLNLQAGVEDAMNPEIYNSGIIRICSTENPGIGTDTLAEQEGSRWVEVGYCGNSNLKCWLDTQSVQNSIDFQNIENEALEKVNKNYQEILAGDGYSSREAIEGEIEKVEEKSSSEEKISLVSTVLEKVFYNDQKATLIYLRAGAYGELARILFGDYIKELEKECNPRDEKCGGEDGRKIMRCSNDGQWYVFIDCSSPETANMLCAIVDGKAKCISREEAEEIIDEIEEPEFKELYEEDISSPAFIFNDGKIFVSDFCYKYSNSKWYWSTSCNGPASTIKWNSVNSVEEDIESGRVNNVPDRTFKFIESLEDKSYFKGVDLLIKRTKADEEKGTFNPSLITDTTKMNEKGEFEVELSGVIYTPMKKIYFLFNSNNEWIWFLEDRFEGGGVLQSVSNIAPGFSENQKTLVSSLNEKSFYEGAIILLNPSIVLEDLSEEEEPVVEEEEEEIELSENEKLLISLEEQKQELEWNIWEDVRNDFSSEFNSAERNLLLNAYSCDDCGTGLFNPCNKEECVAIGFRLRDQLNQNKMCVHTGIWGCEEVILEDEEEPISLSTPQIRVLEKAAELKGRIVEDNFNCFESANSVYEFCGADLSSCVYSDTIGRSYDLIGQIVDGNNFQVATYPERCVVNNGEENLPQNIKLNNLDKGYLISYMYGQEKASHNAIFTQWIYKNSGKAELFDWNGIKLYEGQADSAGKICTSENFKQGEIYCKTFRYYTDYLTDDAHPVYMYWKPV